MTAPDPKWVEAGARASALWHRGETVTDSDDYALAIEVVRAVEPLIREQIAAAIEEFADDWAGWSEIVQAGDDLAALRDVIKSAVHDAAAIARGGAQ